MVQSVSAHKPLRKESDNHVVQITLLRLSLLVIVLVWIALMYDKLQRNPSLAILLVLGVLVILYGGTIRFGPVKIQKAVGQKSVTVASTSHPDENSQRALTIKLEQVQTPIAFWETLFLIDTPTAS